MFAEKLRNVPFPNCFPLKPAPSPCYFSCLRFPRTSCKLFSYFVSRRESICSQHIEIESAPSRNTSRANKSSIHQLNKSRVRSTRFLFLKNVFLNLCRIARGARGVEVHCRSINNQPERRLVDMTWLKNKLVKIAPASLKLTRR